jgi:hypothetical protein
VQKADQQMKADFEIPASPVGIPDALDDHFKLMFDLQVLAFRAEIIIPTIAPTWISSR